MSDITVSDFKEDDIVQQTMAQEIWIRFRRSKSGMVGAAIVLFLIVVAALAPVLSPHDPLGVNLRESFAAPSSAHPMGCDLYGRDVLSRIIYGSRISLSIGLLPTLLSLAIGTVMGVTSGYYGKWVDTLIMRFADIIIAFPSLILSMVIMYTLGASLTNLFIALSIVNWAGTSRIVRSQTLSLKEQDFVQAAKAIGVSDRTIIFKHILPNCFGPLLVRLTMGIPGAIMAEASLSFLGVGAQPPTPSWGLMISTSKEYLFTAPWNAVFPGIAILVTVLAFNFLGDGLRDALDPFMKR